MASTRSVWERFFKDAGIPSRPSSEYAMIFSDNRMRFDMLNELNKELLLDLGIKAIGDVIAILRYAKSKHAEMSRQDSPPLEITSEKPLLKATSGNAITAEANATGKSQKSIISIPFSNRTLPEKNKDPIATKKVPAVTITKVKAPNRKSLSDRFDEFETETKKKKMEEAESAAKIEKKKVKEAEKPKTKGTVFTIQLPSKQPTEKKDHVAEVKVPPVKAKVTLVPAQGKRLDRNKQSTSIFDRLGQNSSTPKVEKVATKSADKSAIFSRLGVLSSESKAHVKVQKVSAVLRPTNRAANVKPTVKRTTISRSVFNRLGDR